MTAISSPQCASVELHETIVTDGVTSMQPIPALTIPAGRTTNLEPGGIHVMCHGAARLEEGGTAELVLDFVDGSPTTVEVTIENR